MERKKIITSLGLLLIITVFEVLLDQIVVFKINQYCNIYKNCIYIVI